MTHLTKSKVTIENDYTEFMSQFTKEEFENVPFEFQNGKLISIDTTNSEMIAFAESKGLTPD